MKPLAKIISIFGNRASWASGPIIHTDDEELKNEILKKILEGLEEIAKENNLIMLDGYLSPQDIKINKEYKKVFSDRKYLIKNYVTYVSDLSISEECLWNNMHKNAKRDITKAIKSNIVGRMNSN